MVILNKSGPQRIGDLAGPTSLEASTVSRAVKALQRAGCVIRERSAHDERVVSVTLTTAGHSMVRRILPLVDALEDQMIVDLSAAEVATLKKLLARLNFDLHLRDFPLPQAKRSA
jgi:DNA-binding MarR family transcriptional regulator